MLLKPSLFIDLVHVFLLRFNISHLNVAFWITRRPGGSIGSQISLRLLRTQKLIISLRLLFLFCRSRVNESFELWITLHECLVLKLFFPWPFIFAKSSLFGHQFSGCPSNDLPSFFTLLLVSFLQVFVGLKIWK